jgi:CDP-diacylglycerol--glycerol-3-phosphate 3-phosphatidyltransferase
MTRIFAIWRESLHTILDVYERRRGSLLVFFPLLFLFFTLLNVGCYWLAIYTTYPQYMETAERANYLKLQIPVGVLGALFDSLSFFLTIWIIRRALAAKGNWEYAMHLSVDLVIAIIATFWVLFIFTTGGWFVALFEEVPEALGQRTEKYTLRAVQAIQDPTGSENAKNIYFGIVMGMSAALPTCLHAFLFLRSCLSAGWRRLFPRKNTKELKEDKSMGSIYDLKPKFQALLRPITKGLAKVGVTANQVTLFAALLSIATGACVAVWPTKAWPLLVVPGILFVRMALNAIDGMLAREHDMKSKLGAVLNEIGDVMSDAALFLPLAWVPGVCPALMMAIVVLAVVSEMTGVVAVQIGASRRYDGPMGKSDRAFVLGVISLLLGCEVSPEPYRWLDVALGVVVLLLSLTILNRARRALKEAKS